MGLIVKSASGALLTANTFQFIVLCTLFVACWAIAPALICERRLRALDRGRGWGLFVGAVLGPLGVAVVNIFITEICLALTPAPVARRSWRRATELPRSRELAPPHSHALTLRDDLLALGCLWAAALAFGALLSVGDARQPAPVAVNQARPNTQATLVSARGATARAAAPVAEAPASGSDAVAAGLPAQTLNRTASVNTALTGSRALAERLTISPPSGSNENGTTTLQAAQPTAPPQSTAAHPVTTNAPAVMSNAPIKPTVLTTGASPAELTRLVVPAGLRAYGTISGMGTSTTLTIACAECTHELGAARLSASSIRAALKAAGVHIVVLINSQDSWTFML